MRVALADDAVLFREGIARVLSERGFEVVAQFGNAEELLERDRDGEARRRRGRHPDAARHIRTRAWWRLCRSASRTPRSAC